MKITNTTKEGSKATVELELSAETLENGKALAYSKAKKDIMLPGFRKGHAPRKMVESIYGKDVFLEDAINEIFPKIGACLTESGLHMVDSPSIKKLDKLDDGAIVLTLEVFVYPEVTLGQYKGLEVSKDAADVPDSDIDKEIERLADSVSRLETVEREARLGDTANIDFEGFIDGIAFEGGDGENFDLQLGSGQFIPGFEEQVVGMSIGQEKDIDVTFPEDYQADMAGKDAVFHVKLNGLKEKSVPALDDEFVKDVSEFDTMEELRADIRARFEKEKADAADKNFRTTAITLATDNMEADIPECMVNDELEYQLQRLGYQLSSNGLTTEQYAQYFGGEEKLHEMMRPNALRQVKVQLLLTKVAEVEELTVTDEELEAEFADVANQYQMTIEDVKKQMNEENLRTELLERKAGDIIAASAIAVAPKAEEEQ